jgi:hypothetical protein
MATLGMITIKDVDHEPIFTLENPFRQTDFDSRIDAGEYICEPYSGTKFKNVYKVLNVPRRSDILFHAGNTEKNTLGCILLGLSAETYKEEPHVGLSKIAMDYFRDLIGQEPFKLRIFDGVLKWT